MAAVLNPNQSDFLSKGQRIWVPCPRSPLKVFTVPGSSGNSFNMAKVSEVQEVIFPVTIRLFLCFGKKRSECTKRTSLFHQEINKTKRDFPEFAGAKGKAAKKGAGRVRSVFQ